MATNTTFDRVLRGVINAVQYNAAVTTEQLKSWGLNEAQTQKVKELIQAAKLAEHANTPLKVKDLKDRLVVALDTTTFHLSRCDGAGSLPDPFALPSSSQTEQPSVIPGGLQNSIIVHPNGAEIKNNAIIPKNFSMVDELSDDCLLKVFGLLSLGAISTCNQVCKQWNQFLNSDLAWQHLWQYHFPSTNLGTIQNFPEFVNHLRSNLSTGVCSVKTLRGHTHGVYSIVLEDGKLLSGSWDNTIKIWDLSNPTCIATLQGHENSVSSLAVSNGKLFSGSWDKTIKIWDLSNHTCIATLSGHENSVSSLAISDGKLFSGSCDKTIKIWDLSNHTCIATLSGHEDRVFSLAVSNGKLFSGSWDNTIKIWDLSNHTCIATLQGHTSSVRALAVSNGKLFSGSWDKTIKIWDLSNDTCIATLSGHEESVLSLAVSNGKLFSGSWDKTIKIWDLSNHTCIATFQGHTSGVPSLAVSNGKLFSGSDDNTIKIWDFTASHAQIFEEIANELESQDQKEAKFALERFSKMPKAAKNKIFGELYKIIKPKLKRDYWGCAEDAFYGKNGQSATGAQKAQAIRNYLKLAK
jgi:WD40 repeat protein